VADLQGLTPGERRRFRTGRPCLDLVHTGGEGEWAVWELLHDSADLEHWLGVVLDGTAIAARPRDLAPARDLRRAVCEIARGAAAGTPPRGRDVAALNAFAAAPALVPQLGDAGAALAPGTAAQALSTLARDAIDLFGGPLAARIRVCAAEDCGLLFVDASRPGRRRWCSMERCGNLAKTRAFRAR